MVSSVMEWRPHLVIQGPWQVHKILIIIVATIPTITTTVVTPITAVLGYCTEEAAALGTHLPSRCRMEAISTRAATSQGGNTTTVTTRSRCIRRSTRTAGTEITSISRSSTATTSRDSRIMIQIMEVWTREWTIKVSTRATTTTTIQTTNPTNTATTRTLALTTTMEVIKTTKTITTTTASIKTGSAKLKSSF